MHYHIIPKPSEDKGLRVGWPASKLEGVDQLKASIIDLIKNDSDAAKINPHRLNRSVVPSNYDLTLTPDLNTKTFDGRVRIDVDVAGAATTQVIMHAHELEIASATAVPLSGGAPVKASSIDIDTSNQRLTLSFPAPGLAPGAHVLDIEFTGILNDKMAGFYSSTYRGADGTAKTMATTQFEATDARRAFPCWDEPAFKATFDVTLIIKDQTLTALSNMPIKSVSEPREDGSRAYSYFRSPVMSTYLLAFIVGELEKVTARTAAGAEVNIYATPGKLDQTAFSLAAATKVLDFFSDYMGVGYPLPKCDLVGIPDFASGAMENWGLITFRETALFATDSSSVAEKQRVAYVVAHELAHQWFGNLVTMEFWSDLWLNEGFATWAGHLAVAAVFPEWDVWTQFTKDDGGRAMETDALLSSHPIQVTIRDPAEIDQVFDALSYSKGACVIRMLEDYVGAETFRRGLRTYLYRHQYKNTVTADLWAAISEAAGFDVAEIMDSWCLHTGFPVVTVQPSEGGGMRLTQRRFLSGGEDAAAAESKGEGGAAGTHIWSVPVKVLGAPDAAQQSRRLLVETASTTTAAPGGSWFKLNAGQTSFVRVNYSEAGWAALKAPITSQELSPVDRLGLASDAFALAKAGFSSAPTALDLALAYAAQERDYSVWCALAEGVGGIAAIFAECDFYPKFEEFARGLYAPLLEHLGWEPTGDEKSSTRMLRSLCLASAAKYGVATVVEEANRRFNTYVESGDCAPDLLSVVFKCAIEHGGKSEFDAMLRIFEEADTPQIKQKALVALGQTRDPELVARYLDFAFSGAVRSNNVLYIFMSLAGNRYARDQAWQFVKENWESKILKMFRGSHALLAYMVALPLRGFVTEAAAADAEAFFKENPVPEATMKLSQSLEAIRTKAKWLERDREALGSWLATLN